MKRYIDASNIAYLQYFRLNLAIMLQRFLKSERLIKCRLKYYIVNGILYSVYIIVYHAHIYRDRDIFLFFKLNEVLHTFFQNYHITYGCVCIF